MSDLLSHHLNQIELSRRWRISPRTLERWRWLGEGPQYLKIGGRVVYDPNEAKWKDTEQGTGLSAEARHDHRYAKADEAEAGQQAGSDSATSQRDQAEGSVTIEGNTAAIPDGLCIISGARAGIDGA